MADQPDLPRSTVPIGLTERARIVIESVKARRGVAKQEAVARMLEWFAAQSDDVQREILDKDGDAVAALIRERMSASGDAAGIEAMAGLTPEAAARTAKNAVDALTRFALAARDEAQSRKKKPPKS